MNQTEYRLLKMRIAALEQAMEFLKADNKSLHTRLASQQMSSMNDTLKRRPGRPKKNDGIGTPGDH